MQGQIRWEGDVRFRAETGSGHALTLDGPIASGGDNAGPRPMELMLLGVGACASYDVVMILKKSRQAVTGCVARLEADQANDPPQVFTRMHLHFVVTGHDLSLRKVTRAVRLSVDTYCPASITLQRSGVVVEHSVEVVHEAQPG